MKRMICFLLALVLILPCLPGVARAEIVGDCGDDLSWRFSDGVLTISGTGPMPSYAYEEAPWQLGGMAVRQLILEEGVTEIGSFAFRDCTELERISLPASLTSIGQGAFSGCESVTALSIPDIAAWMQVEFACWYEELYDPDLDAWREEEVCSNPLGCSDNVILYVDGREATAVTLPEGLVAVGSNSFRGYKNLTALNLPASVKTFGDCAFSGCTGLKDVYYSGTASQLPSIRYGTGNELLIRAAWHCGEGPHVHDFSDWETVTPSSCTEPGLERRYCTGCDHFESRSIPMTPTVTVSANTDTGKPKLSWNSIAGAHKYRIYRSTSKSGTYAYLATTSKTAYTDTSANAGTNYYYKVRALDSENGLYSGYSPVVNRMCDLPKPTVSLSVNTATGKPVVKWETVDGAAKYYVYRSTQESSGYRKVYTAVKARSYEDTAAEAGTAYYYKVMAVHEKSSANSAYSTVVNRVCDLPRPTVTLTLNSKGYPYLKWSEIDGALRYRVYRSESKSGTYDYIGATASLKYADKTAEAGTKYYYKIRAIHENSDANSAYSSAKAITVK